MGEYLSTPNKTKESDVGENSKVRQYLVCFFLNKIYLISLINLLLIFRYVTLQWVCRAGANQWKMPILHNQIWKEEFLFSEFLMGMEVSLILKFWLVSTYHLKLRVNQEHLIKSANSKLFTLLNFRSGSRSICKGTFL